MRFAALLVEHLPICVETLCDTGLITKPVVILRAWDDRVIDASAEASSTGISHGDSRQRVEQLCPQAVILTAREELYQTYHNRLRSILLNFANAVETADLGELVIEMGALARAFPVRSRSRPASAATRGRRDPVAADHRDRFQQIHRPTSGATVDRTGRPDRHRARWSRAAFSGSLAVERPA